MMEQRLIDANALIKKMEELLKDDKSIYETSCVVTALDMFAPTILTIPENPTNGDMIKALFKPYNIVIHEYHINIYLTENDWLNCDDWISFGRHWWNAPYKADKEVDNEKRKKSKHHPIIKA